MVPVYAADGSLGKLCTACPVPQILPLSYFYLRSTGRPYAYCKKCANAKANASHAKRPEHRTANTLKYWAANPDVRKVNRQLYDKRARTAEGRFTAKDIAALREAQAGKCYYCGVVMTKEHIEHKQPLSRGGTNWTANLCLACPACNHAKGTKTEAEFLAARR